jgi:flagellar basal-body rod modification protein FlgD
MNPITPADATATTTAGSSSSTPVNPSTSLDENSFLKLMMVQLQNQDPLDPSDPTQYLSELAQLTSVEQQTNIAQSSAQTVQEGNTTAALSLLGHTVTYTDASGATQTGTVQKVQFTSSGPTLTINGTDGISTTSVSEVS